MEFTDFIKPEDTSKSEDTSADLAVQQEVVASLAADKAEQDERISSLQKENDQLKAKISEFESVISEMKESLGKVGDLLAKNTESPISNQISLLDRTPELQDRFPGETRDQVLEVLAEARDAAEKAGRLRRAQLLEGVLVANVPTGTLAREREELQKLFVSNGNIVNGTVIESLKQRGIAYKNGEEYLLIDEIINRNY